MRLVETLLCYGNAAGLVEARPTADGVLIEADGTLNEVALVELLAQGYAVIKGYDDLRNDREISRGFLVGVKKLRIAGEGRADDRLLVRIRTVGSFEGFAVAEGEVTRGEELLASGTIKLWIVAGSAAGGTV